MIVTQEAAPTAQVKRELPQGVLLVVGVMIVPALIAIASPWGFEPGTETFVHVAFAVVAGQTVAVLTALAVLAVAIVRLSGRARIATFALIAVGATALALNTVNSFAEQIVRAFGS
jgi:hypothetical protein